jgi:transaldolase
MERLQRLFSEHGQSPWLDNLKRSYLTSGHLAAMRDGGVRGLTSNPTIFQKAIDGSADYDTQFRMLAADDRPIVDDYWSLVTSDINGALEVFEPTWEASDGVDGYVSVEVAPDLAHDQAGTFLAATALHKRINKPNVMVKIPATAECVGAIEDLIAQGRSINVTLIFSLDRYRDVMEAYVKGLERYSKTPGAHLDQVASVASFFISRVDVEIDRRLGDIGSPEALALRGTGAVAQGKLAYRDFTEVFSGPRWDALVAKGARVQRPLWASTGTKNPAYSDTLYVDELIGPHTVNTLPEATLEAFADHGTVARRIDVDVDQAAAHWAAIADVGVDLTNVGERLEAEGVASFTKSFDELLASLESKAATFRS